ncbi:MAG: chemotaxis response regulator protein-glutamate methylesterase [Candidatus Thiodiazotropha sp. (ex Monitilora ramsayi)]|nr:chemotaxis response regulator protein-glutamate methylesterase [Candidatus Thiodiazotropha sp. (ex Monitilora ramsayi)]
MGSRLKVLIVDDSAFFRNRIAAALNPAEEIEVVGIAANGQEAIDKAQALRPDVITMDVEMPLVDGISAVRTIMAESPTRIIMFSALTKEGAKETLEALDAGALDFLPKDMQGSGKAVEEINDLLLERVRAVGRARLPATKPAGMHFRPQVIRKPVARQPAGGRENKPAMVAIGASTGGPVALRQVLTALPRNYSLPVVVAVHMPGSFTKAFAERLNAVCAVEVKEAVDREMLKPGMVLIAPGGKQMTVERGPSGQQVRVNDPLPGQIYHPSVDLLLSSVATSFNGNALAIVLTGMGSDGMEGAKKLKTNGSGVWSQSEKSCVVYGMPQAVERAGLSDRVLTLDEIGPTLARVI